MKVCYIVLDRLRCFVSLCDPCIRCLWYVVDYRIAKLCVLLLTEERIERRVCSCHFRDGQKANGPEMFDRNKDKLFTEQRGPPTKRKTNSESKVQSLSQMIEIAQKN